VAGKVGKKFIGDRKSVAWRSWGKMIKSKSESEGGQSSPSDSVLGGIVAMWIGGISPWSRSQCLSGNRILWARAAFSLFWNPRNRLTMPVVAKKLRPCPELKSTISRRTLVNPPLSSISFL
jgi:hypothetical protein